MENRRRPHKQQKPEGRNDSKGSASSVTSFVTVKPNATRKHATLTTERSELETDNKRQKTALNITENWYARFLGT